MRAAVPAFVLLFIGLVAAIPFRRPSGELLNNPGIAAPQLPLNSLQPASKSQPNDAVQAGNARIWDVPNALSVIESNSQKHEFRSVSNQALSTDAHQIAATARYDEVAVPLQKPTLGSLGVTAKAPPQSTNPVLPGSSEEGRPRGSWKTGLAIQVDDPQSQQFRDSPSASLSAFDPREPKPGDQYVPFDFPAVSGDPAIVAPADHLPGRTRPTVVAQPAASGAFSYPDAGGDGRPADSSGTGRVRQYIREPLAR